MNISKSALGIFRRSTACKRSRIWCANSELIARIQSPIVICGAVLSTSSNKCDTQRNKPNEHGHKAFDHENEHSAARKQYLATFQYPHKSDPDLSIKRFVEKYSFVKKEETLRDTTVCVAGRILTKRDMKQLMFYIISEDGRSVQVKADKREHLAGAEDFHKLHEAVKRGDYAEFRGHPHRTRTNELSVLCSSIRLLAPCLPGLVGYGSYEQTLTTHTMRRHQPYFWLMCDPKRHRLFQMKAKLISFLRQYLTERDFVEVETPMLAPQVGGASAAPFKTHHKHNHQDLFLRISPELYLKMLVIGGMSRVFEIGKVFRNEGESLLHSHEFTTCEFYQAHADYEQLMKDTETLLREMCMALLNSYSFGYGKQEEDTVTVHFEPAFERICVYSRLQELSGNKLPEATLLHTEESRTILDAFAIQKEVPCAQPRTSARLLDKLIDYLIARHCTQPTFLINHPQVMSPLAKWHRSKAGLTERFECFVLGKEICNAYTELNDPQVQRHRFEQQANDKAAGDDEAQLVDHSFCTALEYGLPPTAGWGLGIDRLTMFLTNQHNIKDVQTFPLMAPPPKKHEVPDSELSEQ